jgi:hypothetical protein
MNSESGKRKAESGTVAETGHGSDCLLYSVYPPDP